MKLSKHFTLEEFTKTSVEGSNEPEREHMIALHVTAFGFEQARAILGNKPIILTSGYRNRRVNRAVGGVSNSDHALGYAGDFYVRHMQIREAAEILAASSLVFDQLILERNDTIIHLSFNPRLRREVLRQPGGPGTPFFAGLE